MSTTLITLGVVVALLAILLTPGFLDFASVIDPSVGGLTIPKPFVSHSSIQEISSDSSIEAVSVFLKRLSASR